MKTTLFLCIATLFFTACSKDSPSLHEQMVGKWRVESYAIENYDPVNNSSTRHDVTGRPADYFEFLPYDRILIDFDTAGAVLWQYNQINVSNLKIERKPWAITRLNEREFHLSLNVRDSSFKNGDVVVFRLARP